MGRANKKHIHKYHKVRVNKHSDEILWACGQSDCYHFMPKHYEATLPGKATICWECGEVTVLDERNMQLDKPVCYNCTPEGKAIKKHLEEIGAL